MERAEIDGLGLAALLRATIEPKEKALSSIQIVNYSARICVHTSRKCKISFPLHQPSGSGAPCNNTCSSRSFCGCTPARLVVGPELVGWAFCPRRASFVGSLQVRESYRGAIVFLG